MRESTSATAMTGHRDYLRVRDHTLRVVRLSQIPFQLYPSFRVYVTQEIHLTPQKTESKTYKVNGKLFVQVVEQRGNRRYDRSETVTKTSVLLLIAEFILKRCR